MISGPPGVPKRSYRLTRNFAVASAIVLLAAGFSLAQFNLAEGNRQLAAATERHNSDLGRALSGSLWPRYGAFVNTAYDLKPDLVRIAPQTAGLRADVESLIRGSRVLKVKLYDQIGHTVFSTDAGEIGDDDSTNPSFRLAASGRASSFLAFAPLFDAFDRPVEDRWILASYVPVTARDDGGGGVFEIFSDVTDLRDEMRDSLLRRTAVTGGGCLLVFVALLVVVWRADSALSREQERNIALSANAIRAEAANRSKSEFLANMSHELRTPLNAIIGFSDVIASETMGPTGTPAYKDYARDINDAGKHLLAIINDVLDLARLETGAVALEPRPFDAAETAGAVVRMLRGEAAIAGHALVLERGPGGLTAIGDVNKARQIIVNLLSNAIKFTPRGGAITVRVAAAPGTVQIAVSDTGIGIAEEDLALALSPFGQIDASLARRYEGTGLGLTLSHKFAELMGGSLRIDSARGKGTTVTVSLPTAAAVVAARTG
ncbi:MAG TPA: ATP-binding protein [Alphaproteobacteria bacterium]|nr:ATP-binding protein [Alphaproteobacteria bacterium]